MDFEALERATATGRPVSQVSNPQVAVAEYERFNVLVATQGRVQLALKENASRDLVRRASAELLRQIEVFNPRAVGFNGVGRIEVETTDDDPVRPLVNVEAVQTRLEATLARAGLKLVYPSEGARITVDVEPDVDDELGWATAINRHYEWSALLGERDSALSWFAALKDELPRLIRRLVVPSTAEREHAA